MSMSLAAPALTNGGVLVGSGGLAPAWPSALAPGLQATCYGCRPHLIGRRSAEPHGLGLLDNNLHGGYLGSTTGLRQLHPGPASSFQHVRRLRRSAEPHRLGHGVGILNNNVHGLRHFPSSHGVAQGHPGAASSFQHVERIH